MQYRCLVKLLLLSLCVVAVAGGPAAAIDFTDVAPTDWIWAYVQGIADAGVTTGYKDGTYHPEGTVTRDQMAVFVARAMVGGDDLVPSGPATATFPDVEKGTWAYNHIEYIYDQGVVTGFKDGTYAPKLNVNRAQMAAYIARAISDPSERPGLPSYTPPTTPTFTDVAPDYAFYPFIEFCSEHEVVTGFRDGTYAPTMDVTRAQMAAYLCRAFGFDMPPQPYDLGLYFPLAEGDEWIYERNDTDVRTFQMSGTASVGGQTYSRMLKDNGDGNYWRMTADTLYFGRTDHGTDVMTMDPPFALPRVMAPGDTGTTTSTVSANGTPAGAGSFTYTFVGTELVETAAGTFSSCPKLEITIVFPGPDTQHFYMWLAKGVGEVMEDERPFGGSDWRELIAATVGGVDYPATPYAVTDYWPLGQGDTWSYLEDGGSYTWGTTISGTTTIGGQVYSNVTHDDGDIDYMRTDATGFHMGGQLQGSTQVVFSPALSIPNTLRPGESVHSTTTVYAGGVSQGTLTFDATFAGVLDVSVPAGDFASCYELHITLTNSDGSVDQMIMWDARGVGTVKQWESPPGESERTSELTSATVGGVTYP